MTLYGILDSCARDWWYHAQLRTQGEHEEARRRERKSILSNTRALKTCRLVTIGRGGWTAYLGENHTMSGHYPDHNAIPRVAASLGIPVVDTRTVPDENLNDLINLPMYTYEGRFTGTGAFDYAPLEYLLPHWVTLGATFSIGDVQIMLGG